MKALLIDVEKQEVREIDMKDDFREIYKHIGNGCDNFESPIMLPTGDAMYCDGMGIYKTQLGGVIMDDWDYPILGNILVQGVDAMGDSKDVVCSREDLEASVTIIDALKAKQWQVEARRRGITVVRF